MLSVYASFVVNRGSSDPEPESLRLELQEALITYRHHTSLVTQAFGFVVAADSALLAYGFTQKDAAVFLIASFMPIIMLVAFVEIMSRAFAASYAAIRLEQKLSLRSENFAGLYFQMPDVSLFSDLSGMEIAKVHGYLRSYLSKTLHSKILFCVFLIQFFLFVISVAIYHYRFM